MITVLANCSITQILLPTEVHQEHQLGQLNGFHFQLARQTALEVNISVMFDEDALNLLILVRGFGIIGGGAVLFSASALAGVQILPLLGEICMYVDLATLK